MTAASTGALLQRFLPVHQFSECHAVRVAAGPREVLDKAAAYDPGADGLIGSFMSLRELPDRLGGLLGLRSGLSSRPRFGLDDFLFLGRDGDSEIAYGLAGRFWRRDYGLAAMTSPEQFLAFSDPESARLVLNFTAEPCEDGTRLTTRTRVHCTDGAALRRFRPYWLLIRPVSGLIRRRILGTIRREAERAVRR